MHSDRLTTRSQLYALKQQPPLAPAVVVCSELALDTPIKLLELCLALLTTLQGVHGTHDITVLVELPCFTAAAAAGGEEKSPISYAILEIKAGDPSIS